MILQGDCRDLMAAMDPESVDAIVTDPPYELGFMSKAWDRSGVAFNPATWEAASRVLKPGGHLLAFGGSRTFHRIAVAIEDAGFEIRDTLCYLYGSGFPKSHDISKAIDKAAGAEREQVKPRSVINHQRGVGNTRPYMDDPNHTTDSDIPATPEAEQWQGWGTALKPAYEPIIVARKPLAKGHTVAANVLKHGTGALNIDGCRIESPDAPDIADMSHQAKSRYTGTFNGGKTSNAEPRTTSATSAGRWPANVLLDEDAAAMLDAQTGVLNSGGPARNPDRYTRNGDSSEWGNKHVAGTIRGHSDTGGASRFFYVAKASRAERSLGLGSTLTVKYNVRSIGGAALCAETVALLQKVTSDTGTVSWLIDESGVNITGLFHRDSLSITLMEISKITTSATWNSSMLSLISASTQDANYETENGGNLAGHVESSNGLMWTSTSDDPAYRPNASDVAFAVLARINESGGSDLKEMVSTHSTVKPIALMRWLVRMVTPPGGMVLDPFTGSGSTGCAAVLEGFDFIGCELTPEYIEIAERRIAYWQEVARQEAEAPKKLQLPLIAAD